MVRDGFQVCCSSVSWRRMVGDHSLGITLPRARLSSFLKVTQETMFCIVIQAVHLWPNLESPGGGSNFRIPCCFANAAMAIVAIS
jgi:hypothetical protein